MSEPTIQETRDLIAYISDVGRDILSLDHHGKKLTVLTEDEREAFRKVQATLNRIYQFTRSQD